MEIKTINDLDVEYVSAQFVTGLCNVSRQTICNWINDGRIEAERDKNNHSWLVSMQSFKEFLIKNDRYRQVANEIFQEDPDKWVAMINTKRKPAAERITMTANDEIEAKKVATINGFDFISIAEREKEYFFTTGELSRLLNVQPAHIGHWVKTGKLRPVPKEKVPKWYDENFKKYSGNLFSSKDVAEFLKNNYKYRRVAKVNIMAIAATKISLFDIWTAVTL